jgi:hypothetical protein
MALQLLTPRQVQLIVSSIRKVMQTGEIENLTSAAYKFLNLSSGFIAHYNLYGFRDYYSDVENLRRDIMIHQMHNQWRNFRQGERDYDYYSQKREIYNQICEVCS